MVRIFRRGFTAAEKTEMWDRWQRGESLKAIGRAFGKESSSIYFQVLPHGGIRPAPRHRSRLASCLVRQLATLLHFVAAVDRLVDAMGDVIAEDLLLDPAERRPDRGNLSDDIDAVAIRLDHAGDAADLTADTVEALEHRSFDFVVHIDSCTIPR